MKVKDIHWLVWAGLVFNLGLTGLILYFSQNSDLDYQTADLLGLIKPFVYGGTIVELLAVVLFAVRVPAAVGVGWIGGLCTMPLGFFFAEGCTVTYQKRKYAALVQAVPTGAPEKVFDIAGMNKSPLVGVVIIAAGFFLSFLMEEGAGGGALNNGYFIIILGLLFLVRSLRLQRAVAFATYEDCFAVTPNWWAGTYVLSYGSIVRTASGLFGKKLLVLKDANGQEIKMNFPRNLMSGKMREAATQALAEKLPWQQPL